MTDGNDILATPRLGDRLKALDKEINAWRKITYGMMVRRLMALNLVGRLDVAEESKRLVDSVGTRVKRQDGDIERVSLTFERHGIYLEHGVGKHRPVGSRSAQRNRRVWLGHVVPISVEILADRLAEGYADVVALEASIRVPGIIESKIRK